MKRLTALILLACMMLAVMPTLAEGGYYGSMEVVNCNEWVSLRARPSASATRLSKVPLGAVVTDCRQHGSGWILASYDEQSGYIQAKYLRQCEGVSVSSAMLVMSDGEGAALYETIGALEPMGFIPADTIVRNCAVMASGRAYVEYGSQRGYVSAGDVTPYNELMHFPRQITLHSNLFSGGYDGPAPALRVADAAEFPLADYAFNEYDETEYDPVDADTPRAAFVLYADTTIRNVHLFSASIRAMDMDAGDVIYDFVLEHIQYQVDPEHPLSVITVIDGDTPNLAVGYEEWTGAYHFAFVELSGEDGSILLREF